MREHARASALASSTVMRRLVMRLATEGHSDLVAELRGLLCDDEVSVCVAAISRHASAGSIGLTAGEVRFVARALDDPAAVSSLAGLDPLPCHPAPVAVVPPSRIPGSPKHGLLDFAAAEECAASRDALSLTVAWRMGLVPTRVHLIEFARHATDQAIMREASRIDQALEIWRLMYRSVETYRSNDPLPPGYVDIVVRGDQVWSRRTSPGR